MNAVQYDFNVQLYVRKIACLQSAVRSALQALRRVVTSDALLRTAADLRTHETHTSAERHQQRRNEQQETSPHCLVVFSPFLTGKIHFPLAGFLTGDRAPAGDWRENKRVGYIFISLLGDWFRVCCLIVL